MEIWKNLNSKTEISNLGNIKVNGVLKPYNGNPLNYRYVGIGQRKSKALHRIVFMLFGNKKLVKGFDINHIDGNKQNNAICNLEMITHAENVSHSTKNVLHPVAEDRYGAKLKNYQVIEIKKLLESGLKQKDIAAMYGISRPCVCKIKKGKAYKILKKKTQVNHEIMPGEIWKSFNNDIKVSNLGRVMRSERIIKFYAKDYYCVSINKKPVRVHSMVWHLFGNKPVTQKWMAVNHLDGNIHNNSINNLDLVSYSENSFHAYRIGLRKAGEHHSSAKLSDDDVLLIRFIGRSISQQKIASMFSVGQQTISRIQRYQSR